MRLLAFLALVLLAACAPEQTDGDSVFLASDTSGSLRLPLTGTDQDGATYRLRRATFELNGTAMMTLVAGEGERAGSAISTPLPTGHYQLFLRDGYQLVRVASDGSETLVTGVLESPNPANFTVASRSDRQMRLVFRYGEQAIALGGSGLPGLAQHEPKGTVLASAPSTP